MLFFHVVIATGEGTEYGRSAPDSPGEPAELCPLLWVGSETGAGASVQHTPCFPVGIFMDTGKEQGASSASWLREAGVTQPVGIWGMLSCPGCNAQRKHP